MQNQNEDKYSKKINLQELGLLLRAANEDFEGAQRMKRDDAGSQDSSFRNSLDSANNATPKPSLMPVMDSRETYGSNKPFNNSVYFDNINNLSTSSAFLMDRAESEVGGPGHKKSSTMHMGPHLGKDRVDLDPKLKALGSEISKRISEIRRHDDAGPDVVAMENELAYDETLQQKTTCQHCLMIRRRVIVPKHKDNGNVDFLYCERHIPPGGKGQQVKGKNPFPAATDKSKTAAKGTKPGTNIERSKTPPKKVILDPQANAGKGSEELKKLLEMTEKDLYDANEELKKMGFENSTLQEELENLENAKDEFARQLMNANKAYKDSMSKVESLLEQIKRHLGTDLKLYDKVYNRAVDGKGEGTPTLGGSDRGRWNDVVKDIPPMKAECEDILRKINERAWVTASVKEAEEFLKQLDEARKLRRIVLELKAEDYMNKDIIQKLERYIKDLEEQVDNLKNDPKNANKNNIMKVLQLTKELKEMGIREAELNRDVEALKAQVFDLKEENRALNDGLRDREEEVDMLHKQGSKHKYVANADVEEAIRQLSMIILSKDAEGISEQTRALLKDVFPATMQKSIAQWEQRVRELEEQNKRLLDDYTQEVQRGGYVTRIALEMCLRLLELLGVFDANRSANLPPGLKKFREDLFEDKPKLEQIYEELEEGMLEYDRKLQKRGRESLALDVNRMGGQGGTSNAPMFGYNKDKGKAKNEDESEMGALLRKVMEENEDIQRKLETIQMENSSLAIQLNQARNKEEGLQRAFGELKSKYEALTRGKSPRRETPMDNVSTSRVLKMGGRSVEDSFSVLNDMGADMNWFRAKVNENVDYLMMIHCQALALEDKITRGEQLEVIGRQFETSVSRKGERAEGNYQRGFSFTGDQGQF